MIIQHHNVCRSVRTIQAVRASLACLLAMLWVLATAGCNTTKGVGKDVKSLGQSVEKAADEHGAD